MTHDEVQAWLDRYVEAWKTYDGDAVASLFADEAEYRYQPWGDPTRGRDAIVQDWLNPGGSPDGRDKPGTWWAQYEPWVVEGERAVVVGETKYFTDESQAKVDRHYFNIWTIEFDANHRARSFTEYFMQRKKPAAAAS